MFYYHEENDFILTKEVVFKKVKKANYVIKHKNKFEKESVFYDKQFLDIHVYEHFKHDWERIKNIIKK